MPFAVNLSALPVPQRMFWPELAATPEEFTLYGGTALALRLGHRTSVDFDFFSNASFDPERLAQQVPYLTESERIQLAPDKLTCRVDRGGPVLISFFGPLGRGQVAAPERASDTFLRVASLLDLAGTKAAVLQKRAEVKDYLDIHAILQHGMDPPAILAAGIVVYGRKFNPLITLKALSYFDDVPALPVEVRTRLARAVGAVDLARLPCSRLTQLVRGRVGFSHEADTRDTRIAGRCATRGVVQAASGSPGRTVPFSRPCNDLRNRGGLSCPGRHHRAGRVSRSTGSRSTRRVRRAIVGILEPQMPSLPRAPATCAPRCPTCSAAPVNYARAVCPLRRA
jgi:hypothetical protein